MKQYNVLWLFCEDVSPWLSVHGDDTIETPNIDALYEEGVAFTNCFSPCPVCSPARSGIITGCMPTTIGVHNHVSSRLEEPDFFLPKGLKTIPEIMKDNGYFSFNYGKDDYNFTYDRTALYEGDYRCLRFWGLQGNPITWRDRTDSKQPFFAQFTMWGGKTPIMPQNPVDESKVVVAPYYPDTKIFKDMHVRHYNQILRTDEEVGAIVDALKADGEYENTIIVFMGDHGYELLRAKQFVYDGGIRVPCIIRLPEALRHLAKEKVSDALVSSIDITATTLALCGIEIPDYMEGKNIFAPDYHHDYIISARDRCDFTIDRIRSVRTKEFKYIRNFMTDRPLMQRQYREKHPMYLESFALKEQGLLNEVQLAPLADERPAEELYDMINDPHEIHNLASDPAYQKTLCSLRGILEDWVVRTDDKGQYPESFEEYVAQIKRWGADRCVNPEYDAAKVHLASFDKYSRIPVEDIFAADHMVRQEEFVAMLALAEL